MNKTNVIAKLVLLLIFSIQVSLNAQYEIKSSYLINPDLMIPHIDSLARFWFNSYDNELQGFYKNVSRTGDPIGTSKTMLSQSRNSYAMVRAFMMTGDTIF